LPHEATKLETAELSTLLRRLLDEVDKGNRQETSVDVRCSSDIMSHTWKVGMKACQATCHVAIITQLLLKI